VENIAVAGRSSTPPGCAADPGEFTGGVADALPPAKFRHPPGMSR
jgi:hypothetical protein